MASPRSGRIVVGYHACAASTARKVILEGEELLPSRNDYDWLGKGIYFWEHSESRAWDFATEKALRRQAAGRKVARPAVLGAYIDLGRCFDLTDIEHAAALGRYFDAYVEDLQRHGRKLPANQGTSTSGADLLLRFLDCAVLNFALRLVDDLADSASQPRYQTVRGVFVEGDAVFPGSSIRRKSHVQIAVRDPDCILGYFLPRGYVLDGSADGTD
jgi:hypothetical protein